MCENYLFQEVNKRIKEYEKSSGKRAVNLSVGDCTLPIYKGSKTSMKRACNELASIKSFMGYPPESGLEILKNAIVKNYAKSGVKLENFEIFVNDGAKSDLSRIPLLFDRGVKVLLPNPGYPAYVDVHRVLGNKIEYYNALPDSENLNFERNDIDLVYICNPSNPTGALIDIEKLKKLIKSANERGFKIVYDSAYKAFIRGNYLSSVYQIEGAKNCVVEVNSFSKSDGFTGVRCGYTIVPKDTDLNGYYKRIYGAFFNGVSRISQVGALACLSKNGIEYSRKITDIYLKNAQILKRALLGKGLKVYGGECSPYIFLKTPFKSSFSAFEYLLFEYGLAVTPGVGFGSFGEGYIRLSALCSRQDVVKACEILNKAF